MHSMEAQLRQARLQAFIDFKVKHPRLEEIDDTLMQAIRGHRTYTLLPLYGAQVAWANQRFSSVWQRVVEQKKQTQHACPW